MKYLGLVCSILLLICIGKSNLEFTQKLILIIGLIIFLISIISLYLAYIKHTSEVWKNNFHGIEGFWIELGRSVLLILTNIYLLVVVFRNETSEFLHLKVPNVIDYTSLNISYIFAVALLVLGLRTLIWLHFFKGPKILAEQEKSSSKSTNPEIFSDSNSNYWIRFTKKNYYFKNFEYPYLCYFPYSFINLIILAISNISISLYAFLKNWKILKSLQEIFINVLNDTSSSGQYYKIIKSFELFSLKIIDIAGIYSSLFFWVVIAIAYEILIGWITLSEMGRFGTIITYLTGAFTWIIVIILGFNFYQQLYIKVDYKIVEIATNEQLKIFQETYKPVSLFIRIADVHPLFYVTFIMLILIPIFKLLHIFFKKNNEY